MCRILVLVFGGLVLLPCLLSSAAGSNLGLGRPEASLLSSDGSWEAEHEANGPQDPGSTRMERFPRSAWAISAGVLLGTTALMLFSQRTRRDA